MTTRKPLLALSALVLAAAPAVVSAASVVPYTRMAAADLAPDGYAHHAVLRIDQDFHPNDDYEIAIEEGATMIRVGTVIFGEQVSHG